MGRLHKKILRLFCNNNYVESKVKKLNASQGIVLMYHEVLPDSIEYPAWTVVKESEFKWQIEYINNYFDIISIDEALKRFCNKSENHRPFAIITFDDGYKGNYDYVYPFMKKLLLPFTVYISTSAVLSGKLLWFDNVIKLISSNSTKCVEIIENNSITSYKIIPNDNPLKKWAQVESVLQHMKKLSIPDRDKNLAVIEANCFENYSPLKMMTLSNIRELSQDKLVTIGSHTHSHAMLDMLDRSKVHEELILSENLLQYITGIFPKHFSYPNGNYSDSVISIVNDRGYRTCVTTNSGLFTPENNIKKIPRIGIGRFDGKRHFKAKIIEW